MIYRHFAFALYFDLSKLPTCICWSGDYKGDLPLVAPLDEIKWLSAPFGKTTIAWAVLNFNSNRPMLEGDSLRW